MKIIVNQEYDKQVPNLSQQEYDSLMQSIREYGQLSPILVNQDGIVLDGHLRFRICEEIGIEPHYKVMVFKDKVEERLFVSRSNLEGKGRHLNNFRRTELALKSKPDLKEIAKRRILAGKTLTRNQERMHVDKEIARMANVSHGTVSKVEKILDFLGE